MKSRKVMALLLCLILAVSMLSACGKKSSNDGSSNSNNTSTSNETASNNASGSEESGSDVLEELTLPLCDEKETLSVWTFYGNSDYIDDPNDVAGIQEMEARTNVHIDWRWVLTAEASEKYGLMIASGEHPDIIYFALVNNSRQYEGGLEKGIEDGVLVDPTPLIDKYMPNYRRLMEQYPEADIESRTDTGLKALWSYSACDAGLSGENEWDGLVIRKDWLDDLGLPVPETLDDWHTVLTAFKNEKGADAPLMIGPTGTTFNGSFTSAFGILPEYYLKDGAIAYGPVQPEYKEWVELMAQWYKEGLIDPNFTANSALVMAPTDYIMNNRTGAFSTVYSFANEGMVNMGFIADNPNFYLQAVANPVKNAGDTPIVSKVADGIVNTMIGITTSCKNPELAAKWLDYQYTTEGMLLNMYGVEGVSYEITADGTYQFTDLIMNNPDGYSATDALKFYARGNGLGMYNWETAMRTYPNYSDILEIEAVWTNQDMSICLPKNLFMTDEEANKYNSTYVAIQTMVQENTVNWILGTQSTDNFDSFVDSLYQYGLQDCIDIRQATLDRYNARK